jgi:hypothetical protein
MKKQTAVEWLVKVIDEQQKSYIDLSKKDKSLKKGVDAILTATTLLKMKCNQAKEIEKQQIIEACGSMYSKEEVLEQLNHLMTMPSSKLDEFTDDNGNITIKWFEQFKKK